MAPPASSKPALPAKKGTKGAKNSTGDAYSNTVTLPDGSKVPMRIPPGMPPAQAQAVMEYLRSNPEAAKAAWQQAQAVMRSPGLAGAMLNMQSQTDPSKSAEVYAALKDDPELAPVFEDVKANGPTALQRYWDDADLMAKISAKLRGMQVGGEDNTTQAAATAPGRGKAPASDDITSLHDAAKWGDEAAARRLLAAGADVNGENDRGVSALGVAVGFNRPALAKLLMDSGANLDARDRGGNTVLHYAAGYGRLSLAQLLLEHGAQLEALNAQQQTPLDVARLNKEVQVVAHLEQQQLLGPGAGSLLQAEGGDGATHATATDDDGVPLPVKPRSCS